MNLHEVVRESFFDKVEFEKRPKGSEGACGCLEEKNSKWRNIKYKGTEVKVCLVSLRNSKKTRNSGAHWAKENMIADEPREGMYDRWYNTL